MGYRSDIAYMITFHDPDDYWGFVAEAKLDPDTAMCWDIEEWNSFKQNDKELSIQFSAEAVKWYDSYPYVMCHMNLWNKARDRDLENKTVCNGYYVRIGEQHDDLEESSFGQAPPYDYIDVHRSIQINWS